MSQDQQKNMSVMRHWLNTVNENDMAKMLKELGDILAEDYLLHEPSNPNPKPGRADYLKSFEQQQSGIADQKVTIDDLFAVDDKVVLRGEYEFLDRATQNRMKMAAMVISRFEGGKIKEEWQILAPLDVSASN